MTSTLSIRLRLSAALTFTMAAYALGGDWPQWQGPNRDGTSTDTGLLTEWPSGGPPLAWQADGLGGGYSTPSVAAGRIFGMGYVGNDQVVWALDEKTGKPLWNVRIGNADKRMGYPEGPRATPTIDGELLFTLGPEGLLVCLESATGKERWRKDFKQEFGGRMMSGWGFSESPLVDGDQVICTPGGTKGTIAALNKKTGAVLWLTKDFTDRAAYCSVTVVEIGGVRQYVQMTDQNVVGVAAKDGRVLWKAPRPGSTAVIPTPIYHDNIVYVTSGYNVGCDAFKIASANGQFGAEQLYHSNDMVNHHGGVVRVGDYLYGFSDRGGWICQEFKTGKVIWKNGGVGKGSVSFADGHLYLRSEGSKGTVALVEATPDGYKEKGRFDQPHRSDKNSWPHPVIANGKLYLRDQNILLCYDVAKKAPLN